MKPNLQGNCYHAVRCIMTQEQRNVSVPLRLSIWVYLRLVSVATAEFPQIQRVLGLIYICCCSLLGTKHIQQQTGK